MCSPVCCIVNTPAKLSLSVQQLKAITLQAWTGLQGSRKLRFPEFPDNRRVKVERLSTLRSGRLYNPGDIPGTHLCYSLIRPRDKSMKNPNDPIENRTRALPVRSANPQQTAYSAGGCKTQET
jgi:hypothetical protein